jgi:hypothetical protein
MLFGEMKDAYCEKHTKQKFTVYKKLQSSDYNLLACDDVLLLIIDL